jgi:hypothetical protein
MFTDVIEEVAGVLKSHVDSLPKLEALVGRLEAAVEKLEPVAALIDPKSGKIAGQIVADVDAGGTIADAAIASAEAQHQSAAPATGVVDELAAPVAAPLPSTDPPAAAPAAAPPTEPAA